MHGTALRRLKVSVKPRNLKRVVEWLESYGLLIYGPARDRNNMKLLDGGCMDYNLEDIEKLHKLVKEEDL